MAVAYEDKALVEVVATCSTDSSAVNDAQVDSRSHNAALAKSIAQSLTAHVVRNEALACVRLPPGLTPPPGFAAASKPFQRCSSFLISIIAFFAANQC